MAPPHHSDSAAERAAPASPESGRTSAKAYSVEDAFRLCALAPYNTVRLAAGQVDPTSVAGLLLAATVRQCEGDVPRAEAALERAAQRAAAGELAYVLDLLVPLLISRERFDAALAALSAGAQRRQPIPAGAAGRPRRPARARRGLARRVRDVRNCSARSDDDLTRLRVHQRLALAAYYRGDAGPALEDVAEGSGWPGCSTPTAPRRRFTRSRMPPTKPVPGTSKRRGTTRGCSPRGPARRRRLVPRVGQRRALRAGGRT